MTIVYYGTLHNGQLQVCCILQVLQSAFLLHVWCSKKTAPKTHLSIEMNGKCVFLSHMSFFHRCTMHRKRFLQQNSVKKALLLWPNNEAFLPTVLPEQVLVQSVHLLPPRGLCEVPFILSHRH